MPGLTAQAGELRALATTLGRLSMSNAKDPHAPHEAKAEIVGAMFKLADKIEGRKAPRSEAARPPRVPFEPGIVQVDGRIVRVEVRRSRG